MKDEEGIIRGTGYSSKTLRVNVDHRITDNIKVGVSSTISIHRRPRITNNDNNSVSFGVALSTTPSFAELHPTELALRITA